MKHLRQVTIEEISVATEVVVAPWKKIIKNICAFDNIARTRPHFARSMSMFVYTDRLADVSAVSLCALPKGAIVTGGDLYLVQVDDCLLYDQIPPGLRGGANLANLDQVARAKRESVSIRDECLLVARFGITTWGHWLGELLPKIVLIEKLYPERFRFLLPNQVLNSDGRSSTFQAIWDSLRAHGLIAERILPIDVTKRYEFDRLYCITSIWTDHIMHPGVMQIMRDAIPVECAGAPRRIALLRTDAPGRRQIANQKPVVDFLTSLGYEIYAPGTLTFLDQVALFRSATDIVAVLGSGLSGLIYSPAGVRVMALAPDVFGDRFFYALALLRDGRWADIRGPISQKHERVEHQSSFTVDIDDIKQGLSLLSV